MSLSIKVLSYYFVVSKLSNEGLKNFKMPVLGTGQNGRRKKLQCLCQNQMNYANLKDHYEFQLKQSMEYRLLIKEI